MNSRYQHASVVPTITTDLNVGRGILGGLVPDPRPAGSDLEED